MDGRLSPQSTAISPGYIGGGRRRRKATLRQRGFTFCRQPLLSGPGFGFCGTTAMVVLARGPGCPSRHLSARSESQGFRIPADNFPNELACVCYSVGMSPAWRGLDLAFPSHLVMRRHFRVNLTRPAEAVGSLVVRNCEDHHAMA